MIRTTHTGEEKKRSRLQEIVLPVSVINGEIRSGVNDPRTLDISDPLKGHSES